MNKQTVVEIRQVANGYIVWPTPNIMDHRSTWIDGSDIHVFETFEHLVAWLRSNFEPEAAA